MKKILIVYATAGEGHKRAAVAIKDAFDILRPADTEVKLIDALDYTKDFFKWFYPRSYLFMVTYIPTIWGLFYYALDWKWLYPVVKFARRVVNKSNAGLLEKFLREYDPDMVVTTHFLACEVVSNLKRQGRIKAKLITCVTDFRMHSFWFSGQTDHFCVSFKETEADLVKKWNCPPHKINITGIPIHQKFYAPKNKDEIRDKAGLSKDLFAILITGGGFGVGPIMSLVKALSQMAEPFQVLVVCGHNAELQKRIESQVSAERSGASPKGASYRSQVSIKTYGFIDYVDELMTVSDICITKAGGLICSEALAKKLPLIIIAPIPGQEGRNCALLLRNRAAFRINRAGQVRGIIREVYFNKGVLDDMKSNIERIRSQNPALNIVKFVIGDERNQVKYE